MNNNRKYALVTGATSGVGYELARLFAKEGHHLIITGRFKESLDITASELAEYGARVTRIRKNFSERRSAFELYDEIKDMGVNIDILINDPSPAEYPYFNDTDISRELDIIQLNVITAVVLTKLYLKDMLAKNEGRILNIVSITNKIPQPYHSIIHATRAFMDSFTESLHSEIKDSNVIITSLLPGLADEDVLIRINKENAKTLAHKKNDPAEIAREAFDLLMEKVQ